MTAELGDPRFDELRRRFEKWYPAEGADHAQLCVYHDGVRVLDLNVGPVDRVQVVRSASKGILAVLAAVLHDRGVVDLDAPIAELWPEFATRGKARISTRLVLTHQAGLPVIDDPVTPTEALRWDPVVERLARQSPRWEPGTKHGYHDLTYGWLVGEVLRRATGRSVGELVRRELAEPLGLDMWIGTPLGGLRRIGTLRKVPGTAARAQPPPAVCTDLAFAVFGNPDLGPLENTMEFLMAEVPAANGVTDARSLARLFAATMGEIDGVRLLSPGGLADAVRERVAGPDEVVGWFRRYGSGFMLPDPTRPMGGVDTASFGHYGRGVALVFAEPVTRLSMAFVTTTETVHLGTDPVSSELASTALACAAE
ncbi:MAG: beta-lactamase family protein [Streptosporangiaceae bacterium]|nr:beta-lactamase family protein [Streptosporangiaceae bacterium]